MQIAACLDPLPLLSGRVSDRPAVVGVVPATQTGLLFSHITGIIGCRSLS